MKSAFALPLDPIYRTEDYTPIDLSAGNESLNEIDASSSSDWENYMNQYLTERGKKVAYGGYLERRNLYQRSAYFKNSESNRCIHLGVDFWAPEGTSVHAIADGTVHSFQNNQNHGDYGPTIILRHEFEGRIVHSLYGHLSLNSIAGIAVGQRIKSGESIGWLGDAGVNGDYAPHLHLQLIFDLEGKTGDYPGVCSDETLQWYMINCPDPLKFFTLG